MSKGTKSKGTSSKGTSSGLYAILLVVYADKQCMGAPVWLFQLNQVKPSDCQHKATVPSAKTVDFPLLHSLANISVMQ